jgi:hypothetical protein
MMSSLSGVYILLEVCEETRGLMIGIGIRGVRPARGGRWDTSSLPRAKCMTYLTSLNLAM